MFRPGAKRVHARDTFGPSPSANPVDVEGAASPITVHGRGPVSNPTIIERTVALLMGKPRNLREKGLFQKIALIPLLAWVGLGADGLSSSSYGPQESFRALGEHWYLAVALAVATVITISVISLAYARIITRFPGGGGGYVVANNLLGPHAGVLAGSALTIDYVLTVTVSIAAAGDALFSFLAQAWTGGKFPFEIALILVLITLNARGLKEAITPLVPIFILFIITHVALIGGAIILHVTDIPRVERDVAQGFRDGWSSAPRPVSSAARASWRTCRWTAGFPSVSGHSRQD